MPRPRRRTPGTKYAGGHRIRVTPVPIPNTEVKPDTADGTAWETVWESRWLPAVLRRPDRVTRSGLFSFRETLSAHAPPARGRARPHRVGRRPRRSGTRGPHPRTGQRRRRKYVAAARSSRRLDSPPWSRPRSHARVLRR